MKTLANPKTRPLEIAVLNLLYAQYRATGGLKSDNVRAAILERIEVLQLHLGFDVEIPLIAGSDKRIEARRDLVSVAMVVVPLLIGIGNKTVNTFIGDWFSMTITSALSDAFRVATSEATLGSDVAMLESLTDSTEIRRVVENMPIMPEMYVVLLRSIVTLAGQKNNLGNLWLHTPGDKQKPLGHIKGDLEMMDRLGKYLTGAVKATFDFEFNRAVIAYNTFATKKFGDAPNMSDLDADVLSRHVAKKQAKLGLRAPDMYESLINVVQSLVSDV